MPESSPLSLPLAHVASSGGFSRGRYLTFFLVAILGFVADFATKWWMFHPQRGLGFPAPGNHTQWLWPGVLGFQTSLNEGALFGMGQGMVLWFALLSIVAALGVFYWFFFGGAHGNWTLTIALGAILAGIFGNLFDRLGLHGLKWLATGNFHSLGDPVYAVRDWILVELGHWHFPNFNIADSLLVTGAGLLLIHTFRHSDTPSAESRHENT